MLMSEEPFDISGAMGSRSVAFPRDHGVHHHQSLHRPLLSSETADGKICPELYLYHFAVPLRFTSLGVGHRATECFVFQVIAFVPAITIGVLTPEVRCGYIVPQIDYIMDNFTNRPPTLLEHIQQLLAPATRLSTDNTCASYRSHL